VDNMKMDLKGIGWDSVDWIYLPQDKDHKFVPLNIVFNFLNKKKKKKKKKNMGNLPNN
jgi:hypothetical protein